MTGFTLLEILVVLAVLGILFAGLAQGGRFVSLAWDRHVRLIEQNADLDTVDRLLRSIIERAKPGSKWEPLEFAAPLIPSHSPAFCQCRWSSFHRGVPMSNWALMPRIGWFWCGHHIFMLFALDDLRGR